MRCVCLRAIFRYESEPVAAVLMFSSGSVAAYSVDVVWHLSWKVL